MNIDYGQILKNATARQEALELLELNRLNNAWFGDAANIKNAVFHEVLEIAA